MTVSTAIDAKVAARAMLSHPFYQAWTEGRLPLDTLRAYARQYFHHVEAFPRAVSAVHSACPDRDGRRMLAENLAEEEGIEAGKQDHASAVADVRLRPWRERGGGSRPVAQSRNPGADRHLPHAVAPILRRRASARFTPMKASFPASPRPRSRG